MKISKKIRHFEAIMTIFKVIKNDSWRQKHIYSMVKKVSENSRPQYSFFKVSIIVMLNIKSPFKSTINVLYIYIFFSNVIGTMLVTYYTQSSSAKRLKSIILALIGLR